MGGFYNWVAGTARRAVRGRLGEASLPRNLDASAPTIPVDNAADFPNRDPADELIVATARVRRLTLLTTDTKLKRYRHAQIRHFTPVLEKGG